MQPIDIAEKWTRAALALWDNSHTSDPLAITLTQRVRAHYGNHRPALHEIMATAILEAMNEWQHIREAPVCIACGRPFLSGQQARMNDRQQPEHTSVSECIAAR